MSESDLLKLYRRVQALDEDRRIVTNQMFDTLKTSDRALWDLAVDVFGKEETAARWFAERRLALEGLMPLDLLFDDGRERIVDCLYRIKYGLFA